MLFYHGEKRSNLYKRKNCPMQPFTDVLENAVLKNFAVLSRRHMYWSLFLIKCQARRRPVFLLKKRI